jgi:NMD protein affecting ribosome stability and mRNA decay
MYMNVMAEMNEEVESTTESLPDHKNGIDISKMSSEDAARKLKEVFGDEMPVTVKGK